MKIEGPLAINVTDDKVHNKRTLEISFRQEFQLLQHDQQLSELKIYIQRLYQNAQTQQEGSANREGMTLIMQVCEQILPLLQQQEIDLAETIEMEMSLGGKGSKVSVPLSDLGVH